MIQISTQSIEFVDEQRIQSLTVSNKGEIPILYKVKTNNIKAIDARPNVGTIAPKSIAKIQVRRNQQIGDNVKLQFSYLQCKDPLVDGQFKELWTKYQKNQQSKTLPVKLIHRDSQNKQQKSKIQRIDSGLSDSSADPGLFQSVRVSAIENQQQKRASKHSAQNSSAPKEPIYENVSIVKKKVEQQQALSKKLQSQLSRKQQELSKANQSKQFKQSNIQTKNCSKMHINALYLLVIAFLFFGMGYYFGNQNLGSSLFSL